MKMRTHIVTGVLVAAAAATWLGCSAECLLFTMLGAAYVNVLIDVLGHVHRGRYARRAAWSHSILGSTLLALPFIHLLGWQLPGVAPLLAGVYTHLLLDAVTGGVYPLWPLSKKRVALARIRYDNPLANNLAMLAALLLYIHAALH